MPTYPTLLCQIAFPDAPLVSLGLSTWTDVTPYLRGQIGIVRGRQHERAQIEAGRMTLTLSNADRRFDPSNTASPYSPNILPFKKIRLAVVWASTNFWRFTGFITSWTLRDGPGQLGYVDLECVDAFKLLNLYPVVAGLRTTETARERTEAVLDAIGWPAGDRNMMDATTMIQEMPIDESALGHIQKVATTEGGLFFMARDGNATLERQGYRATIAGVMTLNDDAANSNVRYDNLKVRADDSEIWNQIEVTRQGGIKQTAADSTSITNYGPRILPITGLLFANDTDSLALARVMLQRYRLARIRMGRVDIDPALKSNYSLVLPLDISARVNVRRAELVDGVSYLHNCHVEQVVDTIGNVNGAAGIRDYIISFMLSPTITGTSSAGTLNTLSIWRVPTLQSPWVNSGGGTEPAGYWKDGEGRVYLRGHLTGGSVGSVITILPAIFRPPVDTHAPIAADGGPGQIRIESDGEIRLLAAPAGWTSANWISLAGVRWLNH